MKKLTKPKLIPKRYFKTPIPSFLIKNTIKNPDTTAITVKITPFNRTAKAPNSSSALFDMLVKNAE